MADAAVDFDAYVDVAFQWGQVTYACLCACVPSENQALTLSLFLKGWH